MQKEAKWVAAGPFPLAQFPDWAQCKLRANRIPKAIQLTGTLWGEFVGESNRGEIAWLYCSAGIEPHPSMLR